MPDQRWIVIPNWGKFQHYKKRAPIWIKVYTELSSRDEWFHLSWARRGILISIWMEYASSRGRLRVDQVRHLGATWLRPGDLEALNHAGFIRFVDSTENIREEEVLRTSEGAHAPNGAAPSNETPNPTEVAEVHALVEALFKP